MLMSRKEDRSAYLAALFANQVWEGRAALAAPPAPSSISKDVAALRSIAGALDRLAVHACNYGLTDRQEKRRDNLAARVDVLAEAYGFRAETSGDPRGYVVKLFDPADERRGDAFSGGWGVY